MSKHNSVAKAIEYLTPPKGERWSAFTAFLDDGRICLTNNAAERALRGIALPTLTLQGVKYLIFLRRGLKK